MATGSSVRIRRWMAAGVERQRAGDLDGAERLYRRVLSRDARHPDAWHFLGVLAHQRGDSQRAREHIEKALSVRPDYADAHNNLGRVLSDRGEHAAAAVALREALRLEPGLVQAHFNLGVCLRKAGDAQAACEALEQAIEAAGDHAQMHWQLALARMDADRAEAARAAFQRTIELDPSMSLAYEGLGTVLHALGRVDEAVGLYRRWLDAEPDNPKPAHLLAACGGSEAPERASNDYVVAVFDGFAETFDEKLTKLGYRAPELVAEAVAELGLENLAVLDAGCGTGLCGRLLAARARSLTGVDLSGGMIEKARTLGIYDELAVADLVAYMSARETAFDLVVSADTLIYFGALEAPLAAAARTLRSGGALVFTVESHTDTRPYRLQPHGRYSHARGYVEICLARADLRAVRFEAVTLRHENHEPVAGWLVVARSAC